jgi:hypothetical protein
MNEPALGDQIAAFLSAESSGITIVAPFIKTVPLERILRGAPTEAIVTVYTRWRPSEVALGVSDLGVADFIWDRPGARLLLCDELHAKAFIRGDRALIGSANVTGRALGWSALPNLEILTETDSGASEVRTLLASLENNSVEATTEQRDEIEALAALLGRLDRLDAPDSGVNERRAEWVPHCMDPNELYPAYVGATINEPASHDVRALELPRGLNEVDFRKLLAVVALETTLFSAVQRAVRTGTGLVESDIEGIVAMEGLPRVAEPGPLFNAVCRWMVYLQPEAYRTEPAAMRLVPGRRL